MPWLCATLVQVIVILWNHVNIVEYVTIPVIIPTRLFIADVHDTTLVERIIVCLEGLWT